MKKYANPLPKVGDDIYVGTALHLSHGRDDFQGGLCKVIDVKEETSAGKPVHFVTVEEQPRTSYNWKILAEQQDKMKKRYGKDRGYKDPDCDPRFNRW